jgi:hypothetical protein
VKTYYIVSLIWEEYESEIPYLSILANSKDLNFSILYFEMNNSSLRRISKLRIKCEVEYDSCFEFV